MLKVVRRADTGKLWITGTVKPAGTKAGRRIRQRAGTDDPHLAAEEAAALEATILRNAWHGERPSTHSFSEAVASYLKHESRSDATKDYCRRLLLHFRTVSLGSIDQEAWDNARPAILRADVGPATVVRTLSALIAILHHAERRKWVVAPKFDKPSQPKARTRFFLPDEAERLITAGRHISPLLTFLFGTGCRLLEALKLEWEDVDLRGAKAILWEGETKGGARRVVELHPAVIAALGNLPKREGAVFRTDRGEQYRTEGGYGGQIERAWKTALADAKLADRTPHECRHTWATWHYAIHKDLLRLQGEGGWSSVNLVTRYAHIMPSGHEDAIRRVWGLAPVSRAKKVSRNSHRILRTAT